MQVVTDDADASIILTYVIEQERPECDLGLVLESKQTSHLATWPVLLTGVCGQH